MGPPHVKHLGGGLFELRVPFGSQAHRLLFFQDSKRIVLVHGFTKKSGKTPKKELQTALRRMRDYQQRRSQR
jgi:phage-related protein